MQGNLIIVKIPPKSYIHRKVKNSKDSHIFLYNKIIFLL